MNKNKIIIMLGALFWVLLSALDQTIVSTAIPRIIIDFHNKEDFSWVFSAYMLAMTAVIPIFWKLSDIYWRKLFFLWGITVFIIWSILCGASSSMWQLIAFRVIQWIGAWALAVNASAIIWDIFPPSERWKWQWIVGAVYWVTSVLWPMLGWFLTDYYSWRWGFYINIPMWLLSFALIAIYFNSVKSNKTRVIDYYWAISITLFILCFIWIFELNTEKFVLNTLTTSLIIWSIVFFITFILAELKAKEPILPLDFFKNKTFSIILVLTLLTSVWMYWPIIYLPLILQKVFHVTASNSWAILAPLMLSLSVAIIVNWQIMSRMGKYKFSSILGILFILIWTIIVSQINIDIKYWLIVFAMIITWLWIWMTLPVFSVAIQNAFDHSKIGIISASIQLFRNIWWTVWIAMLGIMLNKNSQAMPLLPAITYNFRVIAIFMWIALLIVLFLPETPLRKHNRTTEEIWKDLELELWQEDDIRETY